jgi:hypothetical protein
VPALVAGIHVLILKTAAEDVNGRVIGERKRHRLPTAMASGSDAVLRTAIGERKRRRPSDG